MDVQVSPLALVVKFVHILAQRSYCTLCDFVFSHNVIVGTILSRPRYFFPINSYDPNLSTVFAVGVVSEH